MTASRSSARAAIALVLLSAGPALAADAAAPFRSRVFAWANGHDEWVERWWEGPLDNSVNLARVARLCGKDAGEYLVESEGRIRWRVAFTVDAMSTACRAPAAAMKSTAPLVALIDNVFEHVQGIPHGTTSTKMAIREGQLVVVEDRYEQFDPARVGQAPVLEQQLDWDRLVRTETRPDPELEGPPPPRSRRRRALPFAPRGPIEQALIPVLDSANLPFQPTLNIVQKAPRATRRGGGAPAVRFKIVAWQREAGSLEVRLDVQDDKPRFARTGTAAAIGRTDRLQLWFGTNSIFLARRAKGRWEGAPGPGMTSDAWKSVTLTSVDQSVEVRVPLKMVDWSERDPLFAMQRPPGGAPPVENTTRWSGSIAVAWFDMASARKPPQTILTTTLLPMRGDPRGLAVKLPHGARYPTEDWFGSAGIAIGALPVGR